MLVTPHLKLWLPMEGNANDASGNGNHSTVVGATLVPGKFGQCYSFDGVDDYIEVPTFNHNVNEGTISFWIQLLVIPTVYRICFADGEIDANLGTYNRNHFEIEIDGRIDWRFPSSFYSSVLSVNTWYFLTFVWTPTTRKIYLNGALDNSVTTNQNYYPNGKVWIGGYPAYNRYANILFDKVFIYDINLSQSDIKRIMCGLHPLGG